MICGKVTCPCGRSFKGIVGIDRHEQNGIGTFAKDCAGCEYFTNISTNTGYCYPVEVVEDEQSIRSRKWRNGYGMS